MFGHRKPHEFAAEIEAHLQLETDRLKEQGLTEDEARDAARRNFGNVTRVREQRYESGGWGVLDRLRQDVRFGTRMLAKTPGSTVVAVLTVALGIGGNAAVFSLLNAVMLRNLPVPQPNRLVLFGKGTWAGIQDTLPDRSWQLFSYPLYKEFRHKNQVFTDVAAIDSILFDTHGRVAGEPELEEIRVELVSGTYFETLGLNPSAGRLLTDADDRKPGGQPVAVASYGWWTRRFAKAPGAVGMPVAINVTEYRIVGVAPPRFVGQTVGQSTDEWLPLAMQKQISPGWNGLEDNLFQSLYLIARCKPGVGLKEAGANTNFLFRQILREYVEPHPTPKQLGDIAHAGIELTPAASGLPGLRVHFSSPLKILMGVVVLVLLIACANVANLLLARAIARQREVAVRLSLGAGRARVIRQLLVESGLLGVTGAAFGALIAWGASRLLLGICAGAESLAIDITPDERVLAFTVAITTLTVLLFGTAPAFYATRLDLASSLKAGRDIAGSPSRSRLSRALVVGQVSLSLVLLAGAGLFLQSFLNLMNIDTGFDKHNVLIVGIDPAAAGYRVDARVENMMESIEERVGSLPSVQGASFAFSIFGGGWTQPVTAAGRPKSDNDLDVFHDIVGPKYLDVMKTAVVLGRGLSARDTGASQRVAVINEAMARAYFPGVSPIGRTFTVGPEPEWQNVEVVGVTKDAKYMSLKQGHMPAAFYPHSQHPMFLYSLLVRYTGSTAALVPQIRSAIRATEPNLPVGPTSSLADLVENSVGNQRLVAQLSSVFGGLATLLACLGIYGVVSYGVARRTNEFGVRMTLGAERRDVFWSVLREVLRLVFIGVLLGSPLPLAIGSSALVQTQLYGLKWYDPLAIGFAVLAILLLALLAGYLPARRATKIDPMAALRYE
jgi:predicted permease